MSHHPGDKPVQRFFAYIGSIAAMFVFAVAAWILSALAGAWPVQSAVEEVADTRRAQAAKVRMVQSESISSASVDAKTGVAHVPVNAVLPATLARLQAKKAQKSATVVPGTETALKQMEEQAKAASQPAGEPTKPPAKGGQQPPAKGGQQAPAKGKKPAPKAKQGSKPSQGNAKPPKPPKGPKPPQS